MTSPTVAELVAGMSRAASTTSRVSDSGVTPTAAASESHRVCRSDVVTPVLRCRVSTAASLQRRLLES